MPDPLNQPGGDTPDIGATLARLAANQEAMQNVIAQQGQMLANSQRFMESLTETLKGGLAVRPPEQREPEFDFEKADMGSVAQFILKEVGKMVSTVKEDTERQISEVRSETGRNVKMGEFEKLKSAKGNEDVEEWLPEMTTLAKTNPNLSMQQLLNLARMENSDKANTLRTKREEAEKAKNPPPEPEAFGGLTPTSHPSFEAPAGKDKKKVSLEEAINNAWKTVVPDSVKQEAVQHDPLF